jgi:hypothetical protein
MSLGRNASCTDQTSEMAQLQNVRRPSSDEAMIDTIDANPNLMAKKGNTVFVFSTITVAVSALLAL